jgi:hypothetical protein
VSWSSQKQKIIAQSSTKAEYITSALLTTETLWLQRLLAEYRGFRSSQVRFLAPFGHNQNLNQLVFLQKLSNRQPDHIQPVVIGRWDSCDRSKLIKTQLRLSSVAVPS